MVSIVARSKYPALFEELTNETERAEGFGET